MKTKKILLVISVICLIIAIGILIFIIATSNKDNPKKFNNNIESPEQALEYVKKLNQAIIEGGSKKDLKEMGIDIANIPNSNIMTGKDSYLRAKPDDEIIKQYKLTGYVKQAENYAQHLEEKIKDNFEFESGGVVDANDYISVLAYYKSFYYREYVLDFSGIVRELIDKEKINVENITEKDIKKIAEIYKIQVKAMEILNKHLDEYTNKNEFHKTYIKFTNGKVSMSADSLNSYFLCVSDFSHEDNNVTENSKTRVQKYLKEMN